MKYFNVGLSLTAYRLWYSLSSIALDVGKSLVGNLEGKFWGYGMRISPPLPTTHKGKGPLV